MSVRWHRQRRANAHRIALCATPGRQSRRPAPVDGGVDRVSGPRAERSGWLPPRAELDIAVAERIDSLNLIQRIGGMDAATFDRGSSDIPAGRATSRHSGGV